MPYLTILRTATTNLMLDSKNVQNLLSVKILSCSWMFYISTCKLPVQRAPCPKPGDQFPVGLEDEDAACLVINSNDVTVTIHCNALRPHQPPSTDFILSIKAGGGKSCNEIIQETVLLSHGHCFSGYYFSQEEGDMVCAPVLHIIKDL